MSFVATLLSQWTVEGADRVPKSGPLIVVVNHFSFVDPPLLMASLPRTVTFVAKSEMWRSPASRLFCQAFGILPIRRGEPDRSALRAALEVLKQGRSLAYFPEGTRGREQPKALKRALSGVALLAQLSHAPIVPVGISGTEVFNTTGDILTQLLKRPRVRVCIGEPFLLPIIEGRRSQAALEAQTNSIMVQVARLLPERYWGAYAEQTRTLLQEDTTERVSAH